MIGFRITVNEKGFCESDDLTAFTMVVEDLRNSDEQRVSLHAQAGDGPLQWLAANLKVGDTVKIEVVDLVAAAESEHEELACGFCARDVHAVRNLIQGQDVAICDGCTMAFSEAVKAGGRLPTAATIQDDPKWVCAFCNKAAARMAGVIVRNAAAICPECLSACNDILQDSSNGQQSSGG
jgi:hypothetical protein